MEAARVTFSILVVEDDLDDQFLLKEYFSDLGDYQITTDFAETYEEAKQLISEDRYDMYLVDHYLDKGTGLDLIKEAITASNRKPFILLTGLDNRDIDIEAIRIGAYDYLPKGSLNSVILERSIRHSRERYLQYEQAARAESRFRTLFVQSIDPIFFTDGNFKLDEVNQSFIDLFGYDANEIYSMRLPDLLHLSVDARYVEDKFEKQYDTKKKVLQMKTSDGEVLEVLLSLTPVDPDNPKNVGYQGVIHDITQLKKAEKKVLANEKLSLTGKMARIIGHEVRNPLTNINMAIEQLRDELPEENEDAALYSDMILRNSDRIRDMIDQLLQGTRVRELEMSIFRVSELMDRCVDFCADRISLNNIELKTAFNVDGETMQGDLEQLKIVVINIMTNAMEAMEETDQPKLEISAHCKGSHVEISIADNGPGMDDETLQNLFTPFFSNKHNGMGLGMAVVQNTILSHNGEIGVSSAPGQGTQFNIKLPK